MRIIGLQEVAVALVSGGLESRTALPRVKQLAASADVLGVILHPPNIRHKDMRVVTGRDRIAAEMIRGKETLLVQLVDCTDAEANVAEEAENAFRRHDYDEQANAIANVERITVELMHERAELAARSFRGRPTTPAGYARRAVSEATGVGVDALIKREQRAKARKGREAAAANPEKAEPVISTMGFECEPRWLTQVAEVKKRMQSIVNKLEATQRELTSLRNKVAEEQLPFHLPRAAGLVTEVQAAAKLARDLLPVSLCPYCKDLPAVRELCLSCMGTGCATEGAMRDIPKELLREGANAMVLCQGKIVSVYDVAPVVDGVEIEVAPERRIHSTDPKPVADDDPLGGEW